VGVTATLRFLRVSPFKVRKYAQLFKGKSVEEARAILAYHPSPTCESILKLLNSAAANAENNHDLDPELLIVKDVLVDGASTYKRLRPRARGRGSRILKRTSHVTIEVDLKEEFRVKPVEAEPAPKTPRKRRGAAGRARSAKAEAGGKPKPAATAAEKPKPARKRAAKKAEPAEDEGKAAEARPKRKRAPKKAEAASPEADADESAAAEQPRDNAPVGPAEETE